MGKYFTYIFVYTILKIKLAYKSVNPLKHVKKVFKREINFPNRNKFLLVNVSD